MTPTVTVSTGREIVINGFGCGGPSGSCPGAGANAGSGGQNPGWESEAWGAALKLDANNIAETAIRATETVIWSAVARVELLRRFFIVVC